MVIMMMMIMMRGRKAPRYIPIKISRLKMKSSRNRESVYLLSDERTNKHATILFQIFSINCLTSTSHPFTSPPHPFPGTVVAMRRPWMRSTYLPEAGGQRRALYEGKGVPTVVTLLGIRFGKAGVRKVGRLSVCFWNHISLIQFTQ